MKSFKFNFNRAVDGTYEKLLDAYLNNSYVKIEGIKYFPFELITFIDDGNVITRINCTEGGK